MVDGKCPEGCVNLQVDREKLKKSIEKKDKEQGKIIHK